MADTNERLVGIEDYFKRTGCYMHSDVAWLIEQAKATATPPADAALADCVQAVADDYMHGTSEPVRKLMREAAAALRARSVPAKDDAALALLDGYMVVRKELTEQMKFNAAFNLSAQFGEDYAMQHKEFAFAVWDEFKKQAEGMMYQPPAALRARAVPDVTESMLVAALKEADPLGGLVDWDETKDCVTRPQMRRILEAAMLAASSEVKV